MVIDDVSLHIEKNEKLIPLLISAVWQILSQYWKMNCSKYGSAYLWFDEN